MNADKRRRGRAIRKRRRLERKLMVAARRWGVELTPWQVHAFVSIMFAPMKVVPLSLGPSGKSRGFSATHMPIVRPADLPVVKVVGNV